MAAGLVACREDIPPPPVGGDIETPADMVPVAVPGDTAGPRDGAARPNTTTPTNDAAAPAPSDGPAGPAPDLSPGQAGDGGPLGSPVADAATIDAASPAPARTDGGPPTGEVTPPGPLPLAGLVLWLDAARGVTAPNGKVTRWEDLSPANNDAFQPAAEAQPAYVTMPGQAPYLRFSGKNEPATEGKGAGGPFLRILDAPSLNFGREDFALLVVAGYENPLDGTRHGTFGAFYSKWAGDQRPELPRPEVLFTGNWPVPAPGNAISAIHIGFGGDRPGVNSGREALNDGRVRLYTARRSGDTLELRINGVPERSVRGVDDVDLDNPGANVGIGSMSGDRGIRALRGNMLLLVAVRGALPPADLVRLENTLSARFSLAP